jgi:hypothetical protein
MISKDVVGALMTHLRIRADQLPTSLSPGPRATLLSNTDIRLQDGQSAWWTQLDGRNYIARSHTCVVAARRSAEDGTGAFAPSQNLMYRYASEERRGITIT